jgi:ATP synthase F1 delta subunit
MIPRGIAKRYATALFNAALKAGISDKIETDVATVRVALKDHPSLRSFLLSPHILTDDKKDVIRNIFKGKVSELFLAFLIMLIDKKRFASAREIAEGYTYLYEQHNGIIDVQVITAVPLDPPLHKKTISTLEARTGKKIKLSPAVDPRIIGGMILIVDDKIIDGSIRFRMEKLRRELEAIRV